MLLVFEDCVLDFDRHVLTRGGEPVDVEPRVFALIQYFVLNPQRLISKEELQDAIWDGRVVSDSAISGRIYSARQALGDNGIDQRIIRTMPKVGFQFIAEVRDETIPRDNDAEARSFLSRKRIRVLAAATILLCLIGGGLWWIRPEFTRADPTNFALALPDKPSIAVLPFRNQTGDVDNDFIGNGLTDFIIATLASTNDLMVISENASSEFRDAPFKTIAETLGIRFVLTGGVQKSKGDLRIVVRLVDALNGRTVWRQTFDRPVEDIFAVQDEIATKVFEELNVTLTRGEQARDWVRDIEDFENFRLFIHGRTAYQLFTPAGMEEADKWFSALYERAPESVTALAMMGWSRLGGVMVGTSKNPVADVAAAREFGLKAIDINDEYFASYHLLGWVELMAMKHEAAIAYVDASVQRAPGAADVYTIGGPVKILSGQPAEGLAMLKKGVRLSPITDEFVEQWFMNAKLRLGDNAGARVVAESILAKTYVSPRPHLWALEGLTLIAAREGKPEEGRAYMEKRLALWPDTILAWKRRGYYDLDQAFQSEWAAALQAAGMPKEP